MFDRRDFLKTAAAFPCAASSADDVSAPAIPIIDAHIHLFDPTRPQGVPWPPKDDKLLYKPALPVRYESIAAPLGIVGAIEIEASPWMDDNQWVLDLAAKNPIIVGTVGNLEPGRPGFAKAFNRFHKNPLFRGIRCGNLWGRDFGQQLSNASFLADLKIVAEANLEMDIANPDPALIRNVVRLTDKVPTLRVVIDHLPHLEVPSDRPSRQAYEADLKKLGERSNVFVKISEVLKRVDGRVITEVSYYRNTLDALWETFGEDRLLYGSDWPNSDPLGTYSEVLGVVQRYFTGKGRSAAEKYFWKNSVAAYRWSKREGRQPGV